MNSDRQFPAILAGLLLLLSPLAASQARAGEFAEFYLSEIILTLSPACPSQSLEADGRKLRIQDNQALFSLVGTSYGGDGRNDFALPDLRGKSNVQGARYCIVTAGLFPSRD